MSSLLAKHRFHIFLLIVLTIGIWILLARPIKNWSQDLSRDIIEQELHGYSQILGLEISYRSLSPSIAGAFYLRNVSVKTSGGSFLQVDRLRIGLGLIASLVGKTAAWTDGIMLEGLNAYIDLDSDAEFFNEILALFESENGSSGTSFQLPSLEMRSASIVLVSSQLPYMNMDIKRAYIQPDEESVKNFAFSLSGNYRASHDGAESGFAWMTIPLSLTGNADLDGSLDISGRISMESNLGSLSQAEIAFSLKDSVARAELKPTGSIEKLAVSWNFESSLLGLEGSFSNFVPLNLFRPKNDLAIIQPWLEYPVNGNLWLYSNLSLEGTYGQVDLNGTIPAYILGASSPFYIDAHGSPDALTVNLARLNNRQFSLAYKGRLDAINFSADGQLDASVNLTNGLDARIIARIFGEKKSWFAKGEYARLDDLDFNDFGLSLNLDNDIAFLLDMGLPVAEPVAEAVNAPRLSIDGNAMLGEDPYLAASIQVDSFSLNVFEGLIGKFVDKNIAAVLADFSIGSSISVYSDFAEISYSSNDTVIEYGGFDPAIARLSFSGGKDDFNLNSIESRVGNYQIAGSASLKFGKKEALAFNADISIQDLPYSFGGDYMDGSLYLRGDYGMSLVLNSMDGIIRLQASAEAMPVPIINTVCLLSLNTDGIYSSPDDWALTVDSFFLDAPQESYIPGIKFTAFVDQTGGKMTNVSVIDRVSTLDGEFFLSFGNRIIESTGLLAGSDGESYDFEIVYDNSAARAVPGLDLKARLKNSPLERSGIPVLSGALDADITLEDILGNMKAGFDFAVNRRQLHRDWLQAEGRGSIRDSLFRLENSSFSMQEHKLEIKSLVLNLKNADAELDGSIALLLGNRKLESVLRARSWSESQDELAVFDDYHAEGEFENISWKGSDPATWPFRVSVNTDALWFGLGRNNDASLTYQYNGALNIVAGGELPFKIIADGVIRDGAIMLEARELALKSELLFPLIGTDEVELISGTIQGNLTVQGQLSDPEVYGTLLAENTYMMIPNYIGEPIGPFDEPFFFTGSSLESDQTDMACGDAKVSASLRAPLSGGLPEDIMVRVKSPGPVPVSTSVLGMNIEGKSSADMTILITGDEINIDGELNVSQGDVVLTTGLFIKTGNTANTASNLMLSFGINLGKSVRIYFPDRRVPLFYGQADPASRLEISYDGLAEDYELKGNLRLRGGNVFYIQRSFYLDNATIAFNESISSFDPIVSLEAETRSRNEQGPVLIKLKAEQMRLSDLSFTLSSVPAMSESDIARLLGHDLLAIDEEGKADLRRFFIENSDLVPQLNLLSGVERAIQDALKLDVFMFRSMALQRWVYDISSKGLTAPLTLSDYLDNTAITLGKYLGQGLYFQTRLRLLDSELESTDKLRLDSEISLEWATPHFLLSWSLAPSNPDTLFVTDQTISLFWSIPLK